MSDLFIKSSPPSEKPIHPTKVQSKISALAGLAGSFQDLIQKAGARIENGISALTGQSTVFGISESINSPRSEDDFKHSYSSDNKDYSENRTKHNDHNDDHSGAKRTDRDEASSRNDRVSDDRDRGNDSESSNSKEDNVDSHLTEEGSSSASTDSASDSNDVEDKQSSVTVNEKANSSNKADDVGKTSEGNSSADAGKGESTGNNINTSSVDKVMGTVLSEMIAASQSTGETEGSSSLGRVNSADSSIIASQNVAASSAAAQEVSSKLGAGSDEKNGTANQNAQLSQASNQSSTQAKTNANGQSANGSNTNQNVAQSNIANQASDLAKAIGEGNKAQVNVSITNESQNLTSRPNTTLFNNTNVGTEALNQSTSGQQNGAQSQNGSNQNSANQTQNIQANGTANGMIQSQAANANMGSNARTGGGEGPSQTGGTSSNQQTQQTQSLNTSTSGLARAGGGESITQPGSVTANQQTQQAQAQSAAQEAKSAEKPTSTGRSMVEQISVKVTKALESGVDKINIQLRPAHMGRVEVKIEMSQDNRLSAMVVVDNRETLETLKNDSRALQRSLLEAGLNTDSGDLNFSLRGEEQNAQDENGSSSKMLTGDEDIAELEEMIIEEAVIASDGRVLTNGRIDVRA
jgi:hypothetical protein